MTRCEPYQIELSASLSGEGSASAETGRHLRDCEACTAWAGEIQEAIAELRQLSPADPGEIFFARQSKNILTQLQDESAFELIGEDLELSGLLRDLPVTEPASDFFPRQSQAIMGHIRSEVPEFQRPTGLWKKSLLAAAALGMLCWGLARFVPFQALQDAPRVQATISPFMVPEASDLDLEGLSAQELDRLAGQLEKRFQSDSGDWDEDDGDWEDLSEPEVNRLIERLQGIRRST